MLVRLQGQTIGEVNSVVTVGEVGVVVKSSCVWIQLYFAMNCANGRRCFRVMRLETVGGVGRKLGKLRQEQRSDL